MKTLLLSVIIALSVYVSPTMVAPVSANAIITECADCDFISESLNLWVQRAYYDFSELKKTKDAIWELELRRRTISKMVTELLQVPEADRDTDWHDQHYALVAANNDLIKAMNVLRDEAVALQADLDFCLPAISELLETLRNCQVCN